MGRIEPVTKARTLEVEVEVSDARYQVDRLNLFVNDVPVWGSKGLSVRERRVKSLRQRVTVDLLPGPNKLQFSAHNERGVESLRETLDVTLDAPAIKPRLFVVAVGVSDYPGDESDLTYAAKDAKDVIAFFSKNASRYAKVSTLPLLDAKATRDNILAARTFLEASRPEDQAILFVAGHGLRDDALDYYFATADVDFVQPATRGLAYEGLEGLLDGIPARRKLALIDTCYSGELDKDEVTWVEGVSQLAGQVRAVATRALKRKHEPVANAQGVLEELLVDLRRGSGATVIASASGTEYALESDAWKNGVFTFSLLDGLGSLSADRNKDGQARVSELRDFITEQVQALTAGKQRPTSRRENLDFDFPVY